MFSKLFSRVRQIAIVMFAGGWLIAASLAQADALDAVEPCFNFLNAQDYVRAKNAAIALLERNDLSREAQRAAYLCLGNAYDNMGHTRDALSAFQQVETLSQTARELAFAYNYLGSAYSNLNELDRAELYDQRALKVFRELGDHKSDEAAALNNLAGVVEERGDIERALQLYQESLELQTDEAKKPSTINNIALIYAKRGKFNKAVEMLREAIAIDQRNGDAHGTARRKASLGNILGKNKQWDAAEKELTEALNTLRLIGDKDGEVRTYQLFAKLEEARGKRTAARHWYEQAETVFREVGQTTRADKMRDAAAKIKGE